MFLILLGIKQGVNKNRENIGRIDKGVLNWMGVMKIFGESVD